MSKIPIILSEPESDRLLHAIKFPRGPAKIKYRNFRNYLAAMFMLHAGLRVAEVVQLTAGMILINKQPVQTLIITKDIAKGGRAREIPINKQLHTEIEYLRDHFLLETKSLYTDFVFTSKDKTTHITPRRIQQVFYNASTATLGRRIWPHVLRHTFATRLMRVTSTRIVQELLGHQSLTSTQIYTHPNSQDLLTAIEKM